MANYIDREAVNKLLKDACDECRDACEEFDGIYADCNQCIMHGVVKGLPGIPAADVVEVKRGRWVTDRLVSTSGGTYGVRRCSLCEAYYQDIGYGYNYCPNCGAKMEGGQDDV